ncbi:MAG: hypothetical protein ACK4XK_07725 [Casimicrobiaceae bacterium]
MRTALVEIDIARDLTEGFAILDGQAAPDKGPEIGGRFHLAPGWFYLVAGVLAVSPSITAYTLLMGGLASLKFAAAAWVGYQLGSRRLAAAAVAAAALPGLAGYQFFGVTHTNFVELFLWLAIAFALQIGPPERNQGEFDNPGWHRDGVRAGTSALAFCLAFHAHPTTIALFLPWLALLVVRAGGLGPTVRLVPWLLVGGGIPLAPALPELFAALVAAVSDEGGRTYARPIGDHPLSVFAVLRGLLWSEPSTIAGTAFAAGQAPPPAWRVAWIVLVGGGLAAALWAAIRQGGRVRALVLWATFGLLVAALAAALLVRSTPFYAAYAALVPLALLVAAGWTYGPPQRPRDRSVWLAIASALFLQWATVLAFSRALEGGWVTLRFPDSGGVKDKTRVAREVFYVTVTDRDRLARHLCASSTPVHVNGPYATALDASQGHELRLAGGRRCQRQLRFGPAHVEHDSVAVLPLPRRLIDRLGLPTGVPVTETWQMVQPFGIKSPPASIGLNETRLYPPRLRDWERGRDMTTFSEVEIRPDETLVVAPLSSLNLGWAIEVQLAGRPVLPVLSSDALRAWRCPDCQDNVRWRLRVSGLAPEFVNIVVVRQVGSGLKQ